MTYTVNCFTPDLPPNPPSYSSLYPERAGQQEVYQPNYSVLSEKVAATAQKSWSLFDSILAAASSAAFGIAIGLRVGLFSSVAGVSLPVSLAIGATCGLVAAIAALVFVIALTRDPSETGESASGRPSNSDSSADYPIPSAPSEE